MTTTATPALEIRTVNRASLFEDSGIQDPLASLQYAFGDLTEGIDGVVPLIRVSATRHFISWGEVEDVIAVYDGSALLSESQYEFKVDQINNKTYSYIETLDVEEDKDGQFVPVEFRNLTTKMKGIIAPHISGHMNALTRPDHILQYIIEAFEETLFDVVDKGTWFRLINETTRRGLTVGGVFNKDTDFVSLFTDILEFLFFVKVNAGKIAFIAESSLINNPVLHINSDSEFSNISATATLKNISNNIATSYQFNWASRKFDSESKRLLDDESIRLFSEKFFNVQWRWGRSGSIALDIAQETLTKLKNPQFVFEGVTLGHFLTALEYNDVVILSGEALPYIGGRILRNAFCTVRQLKISAKQNQVSYKLLFENRFFRRFKKIGKRVKVISVTAITSPAEFSVDDMDNIEEGQFAYILNGFGSSSQIIQKILGNTITLAQDLTPSPVIGDRIYIRKKQDLLVLGNSDHPLGGEIETELREQV